MGIRSKLLLDSRPLVIVPELACLLGLNEAIVVQQVHYWLEINRKAERNIMEGYTWTFNSLKDWQKQFPFLSLKTLQRTFEKLEKVGVLVSSNYNAMKIDRTKWYRIDYEVLENMIDSPFSQNDQMHLP